MVQMMRTRNVTYINISDLKDHKEVKAYLSIYPFEKEDKKNPFLLLISVDEFYSLTKDIFGITVSNKLKKEISKTKVNLINVNN